MSHRGVKLTVQLFAAGLTLAAVLSGCGKNSKAITPAAMPTSPFATIATGKIDIEGGIIEIAARRFGVTKDVLVHEGDMVKKGQVLARQEDRDTVLAIDNARAMLAQSESQLTLLEVNIRTTEREYNRFKQLSATNAIAAQQLDQAGDNLATARAQLAIQKAAIDTARTQLAQAEYNEELTNIRAPVDGKIIRRYANPGSGASTLNVSTMFDLEPNLPHIVRAEIVESSIPDIEVGQDAQITPETGEAKPVVGHVIRIAATFGARKLKSDAANEASDERVVEVVVSAENAPFLIGQRVMVKFLKPGAKPTA